MSKRTYDNIAKAVKLGVGSTQSANEFEVLRRVAGLIAEVFAEDNPRFDRERFLKACGVTEKSEPGDDPSRGNA